MAELTKHEFLDLTKTIFEHSPQAVLIAEEAIVKYCNAAALEMLQINPTDCALIDFIDYRFASEILYPDKPPENILRKRTRFGEGFYEVIAFPYDELLFLFFYYIDVAHTTKDLLCDTAYSLLALTGNMRANLEHATTKQLTEHLNHIDLAIQEALTSCDSVLYPYDFQLLLNHALLSFVAVTERDLLTAHFDTDSEKLFVPMHCKLLHAALVGMIFDLLRLTALRDPLEITLEHSQEDMTVTFACKHTCFPEKLDLLLFSQDASNPVEIMQEYGTHLFRAKRIFSLHNGMLQRQKGKRSGFSLSVSLPRVPCPPMLYSGELAYLDFPSDLSLSTDYIQRFFGLDSEEA